MRQPFYLQDIIFGDQLSATFVAEIRQRLYLFKILFAKGMIEIPPLIVFGKRGVWLVKDARPYFYVVNTVGNCIGRGVIRQTLLSTKRISRFASRCP